jgi:hypothetical protein
MKKKGLILTFLTLCFLLAYTPGKAVGNCDCSWGYTQVGVSFWGWYNTANSKFCDCSSTGDFNPNSSTNQRCTCGGE